MALGIALFSGSNDDSGRDYLLISGAQIAATVAMERTTGRANERKRGLALQVMPMPHRRIGIMASVPLP